MISDRLKLKHNYLHLLILSFWILLGAMLRFTHLGLKPASSIEIATIGYSLGHGFNHIPFDRVISMATLLTPLHLDPTISYKEVLNRLVAESTHPPLYFWLMHWWSNLWVQSGDLVPLTVARSLSAIFGVLTIPAIFSLAWVAWRSLFVAHMTAVLMAISPYGIYLAQEARHYTLTIFWVIISLICLIKATRLIVQKTPVPIWFGCVWIIVNALGVATHYFYTLTLLAEAIALGVFCLHHRRQLSFKHWLKYYRGIYLAGLGTLASCLIWLPLVTGISGNELTSWIKTSYELEKIGLPFFRLIGWMTTMVMLLPIEGVSSAIAITSILILLLVAIWSIPKLFKALYLPTTSYTHNSEILVISSYLISSILIFLVMIYGLGRDISLAARYHFVYFPGLILLIALTLANCWQNVQLKSRQVVIVILTLGLFGSLTVINNYGFQKSRYSDRLAAFIQNTSTNPAIVAMSYNTHSEIRELVSLAYSFDRLSSDETITSNPPQFLLNRLIVDGIDMGLYNLDHSLVTQSKPLDLWAVDLMIGTDSMKQINCLENNSIELPESGYRDRLYHCQ